MNLLEFCIRQDLEGSAPRGMAVLDPLKVVITNFNGEPERLTAAAGCDHLAHVARQQGNIVIRGRQTAPFFRYS